MDVERHEQKACVRHSTTVRSQRSTLDSARRAPSRPARTSSRQPVARSGVPCCCGRTPPCRLWHAVGCTLHVAEAAGSRASPRALHSSLHRCASVRANHCPLAPRTAGTCLRTVPYRAVPCRAVPCRNTPTTIAGKKTDQHTAGCLLPREWLLSIQARVNQGLHVHKWIQWYGLTRSCCSL
jgi:hypothetical protein